MKELLRDVLGPECRLRRFFERPAEPEDILGLRSNEKTPVRLHVDPAGCGADQPDEVPALAVRAVLNDVRDRLQLLKCVHGMTPLVVCLSATLQRDIQIVELKPCDRKRRYD